MLGITNDFINVYDDCKRRFPMNIKAQILATQCTYIDTLYFMTFHSFQQRVPNQSILSDLLGI